LLVYYGFPGATMDTYEADGLLIRVGVVRHRDRDGLRIVALPPTLASRTTMVSV
jgi:hypothetical protein